MMNNKKMYKGMGFVESLVAIILVGVASVVLMRIAASTMIEAVRNERIDKMTQFAIEGATMTETIILEMVEGEKFDSRLAKVKQNLGLQSGTKCLIPIKIEESGITSFDFMRVSPEGPYRGVEVVGENLSPENRQNEYIGISEKSVINSDTERIDYFRYVCISAPLNMKHLNAQVVVGHILSKGEVTAKRDVKDYIYSIIIPL
jgi:hypothetical protein